MDNFLKIVAGIFAVLFIATTALALTLFSVERSAFDAELYIEAFDEATVYQRLPELTAQSLAMAAQKPDRNDLLSIFRNLSDDEWHVFVTGLFPSDVLRDLARDAITQIIAYINGESEVAVLSLVNLKVHLQSPEAVGAVYGMLKAQPDCTVEQLTAMALNQQALTLCNPPESFLFVDLRPIIETQIRAAMSLVPEQVTIIAADSSRLQNLRDFRALRLFMQVSPLLPLLFLLAITAFAVRSVYSWLTWWGYPMLFAGMFSMLVSFLSGPISAVTFQLFIAPVLPNAFPKDILSVFRDLTATIVRHAVQPTLLIAAGLAFFGLVMILLAFLLRSRLQKSPVHER